MQLLLIEDDAVLAKYVSAGLSAEGFSVTVSYDGVEGLTRATSKNWDAIIIDRKLPSLDGLTLTKVLRTNDRKLPILILSSMSGVADRIEGLNAGADDYLPKPFFFGELVARTHAMLRRNQKILHDEKIAIDDLEVDLMRQLVRRGGRNIDLQPGQFRLLVCLMKNANSVVTKTMLLENVWGIFSVPSTNLVETQISRLKSKLNKGDVPNLIHTIREKGYMIRSGGS